MVFDLIHAKVAPIQRRLPGDYGWKAISSADPEANKRKLSAELANGRLAMNLGEFGRKKWQFLLLKTLAWEN